MNKVCHIVGGGDFFGIRPTGEGDFIIAADKGLLYLQNLGITPNLVIGDFDSLGHTPNGRNIIVLPCEKNDTDMGAAVAEGARETSFTSITNGRIIFDENAKGMISVFSHSDISSGVTISGLKYELKNGTLKNTYALGVSNEFVGKMSEISVAQGTLTVVYPSSAEPSFFRF